MRLLLFPAILFASTATAQPGVLSAQSAQAIIAGCAAHVSATYPLERGGEAIAAMAARQVIGKLVVTTD